MTIVLAILAGAVTGWLSSQIFRYRSDRNAMFHTIIGVLGALVAVVLITPLIGGAPIGGTSINVLAVLASTLGAMMVLAVVNVFLRGPAN